MAFEQKDLSGSLFKNDRKNTANHPDYTGSVMVDGVEYWLSAWLKDGKNGKSKWMSLGLKRKDDDKPTQYLKQAAHQAPKPVERGGSYAEDLNDEIPFLPEWRG